MSGGTYPAFNIRCLLIYLIYMCWHGRSMPKSSVLGDFFKACFGRCDRFGPWIARVTQSCPFLFALGLLRFTEMAIRNWPAWLALREILAIHWNSVAKKEGIALQPRRDFLLHVNDDISLAWNRHLVVQAAAKAYVGFVCGFQLVFDPGDGTLQVG